MPTGITEARFPYLARLTVTGRRELASLVSTRVKPAQHLLRRGDDAGGVYLVTGGSLRVFYVSADGHEATLYRVEPGGACVLSLTATFSDEPYPAWVDAGPAGAGFVRVPSAVFHRLVDGEPAFRQFAFASLSGRVLDLMRTLEELGSKRVEQRLARYLLRQEAPDGVVRITQSGIASELGTAREVVFRTLRALSQRRLLRTSRARIQILDRAGLAHAANLEQGSPPQWCLDDVVGDKLDWQAWPRESCWRTSRGSEGCPSAFRAVHVLFWQWLPKTQPRGTGGRNDRLFFRNEVTITGSVPSSGGNWSHRIRE
jgi:CRP/FNR family transcriptional regulator